MTLLIFLSALAGVVVSLDGVTRAVAVSLLVIAMVGVAAAKTEGGWRWRSGDEF